MKQWYLPYPRGTDPPPYPLHVAAAEGNCDRIRWLIMGVRRNVLEMQKLGDTPLHVAVLFGQIAAVRLLLLFMFRQSVGYLLNNIGESPLHVAYRQLRFTRNAQYKKIIKLLEDAGIKATDVGMTGLRPRECFVRPEHYYKTCIALAV